MRNKAQAERYGGEEFHVGDCYVWAQISYLDSPTDYRECLLQNIRSAHSLDRSQMVLLDDQPPSFLKSFCKFFLYCSVITVVVLIAIVIIQEW